MEERPDLEGMAFLDIFGREDECWNSQKSLSPLRPILPERIFRERCWRICTGRMEHRASVMVVNNCLLEIVVYN